jgi:hypothetical protein
VKDYLHFPVLPYVIVLKLMDKFTLLLPSETKDSAITLYQLQLKYIIYRYCRLHINAESSIITVIIGTFINLNKNGTEARIAHSA